MSIIRQINNTFAVPDLRNSATVVRLLIIVLGSLFFLPLISDSSLSYSAEIYHHSQWVFPVLLGILVKAYFVNIFTPAIKTSPYGVIITYFLNLSIFAIVDFFILKTHGRTLSQHFFLFNLFLLGLMYYEASRRNGLAPSISEARLSALTARIRPHFLFNSLNAAISLIRLRPYDAETLLENLANLFRAQLRDGSQSSTLGQEIEWAQEYIAIEQIRMGHMRVQVMWQHQAPDDAETPHLLLQPLLENAVFHGVESTHRPRHDYCVYQAQQIIHLHPHRKPVHPARKQRKRQTAQRQLNGIAQPQRTPDADVRQRCQNPKPPTRRHLPRRYPPALPQKSL